ncbi:MAG: DUF4440 domain-containing protein [bacterium]
MKMKKFLSSGFIVLLFVLNHSFAQSDPMKLLKAIDEFYLAIEEGDVEKRINLLADDFIMMPNHNQLNQDKQQLAEWIRADKNGVFKIKDLNRIDFVLEGGIGYCVNEYYYTYHQKGEEPVWHKTKGVHIWEKNSKGEWQLKVDIWNSSEKELE